jgi:hypothetical protein
MLSVKEEAEVLDELHPLTYMSYSNKATAIGRDGEKAFDKSGKDRSANIAKADKRVNDSAHKKGPLAKLYPTGKKSTLGKKAQAAVRSNAQWNEEAEELASQQSSIETYSQESSRSVSESQIILEEEPQRTHDWLCVMFL